MESDDEYPARESESDDPGSKMRDELHERREARNQLADNVRRYGMYFVAALVLLPVQAAVALGLGAGIVYMMFWVWRSHGLAGRAAHGW